MKISGFVTAKIGMTSKSPSLQDLFIFFVVYEMKDRELFRDTICGFGAAKF